MAFAEHDDVIDAFAANRADEAFYISILPRRTGVIQGRVAMDQAVRILDGKPYLKHVGPKIYVIDKSNAQITQDAVLGHFFEHRAPR